MRIPAFSPRFLTLALVVGSAAASLAPAPASAAFFSRKSAPAASGTASPGAGTAAPSSDKLAKAKQCSLEADKKGLHGKERKAFRAKCKRGES